MKSIDDVKQDMSELYNELKSGMVERETAAELANIAGKYLKAEQLKLARDVFESEFPNRFPSINREKQAERLTASA